MFDPSLDLASLEAAAIQRAEWRLRMLEEVAEIGMDLMRALKRRAEAEVDGGEDVAVAKRDPADAFQRLSRAVRLTLALQARTDEALRALIAGEVVAARTGSAEAACRAEKARAERHEAAKDRAWGLVDHVIKTESDDENVRDDCREALHERLERDEAYADLADKPLREIVQRLCADLDLTPDWRQWTGEDWALPPGAWRPAHSFYNNKVSRVLLGPAPVSQFRCGSPGAAAAPPWRQGARLE